MMLTSKLLVIIACTNLAVEGFTTSQRKILGVRTTVALENAARTREQERVLREELQEKASSIKDEKKYAVTEGEGMEGALFQRHSKVPDAYNKQMGEKLQRLVKPRAYPLFLLEKVFESFEGTTSPTHHHPVINGDTINGSSQKNKIVVLGTGWGSTAFLKNIDTNVYDVTVISPRNYFLFTPMLSGATVGTVEFRSITEPVREINPNVEFLEATATKIDPKTNTVTCEAVTCDRNECAIEEFEVVYDQLVTTVGAQVNTFGIPGVKEHCNFLKQVDDARRIRNSIINCFERANLPGLSDEDRQGILTFAVIGAGPTGIEFASELRDFVEQDGPKYYPKLLKFVRIKVIEASSTVLAPFDKTLQQEAINQMNKNLKVSDLEVSNLMELLLNCAVKEVTSEKIMLNNGRELRYGLAVWAGGNGPLPLTLDLIDSMGEDQAKYQKECRGRLAIDCWMRVMGGEGRILAIGDCTYNMKNQFPATGQVAAQQGEYIAKMMNKDYQLSPIHDENGAFVPPKAGPDSKLAISDSIASFSTHNPEYAKPFQFLNLGIMAYTGRDSALAQINTAPDVEAIKGTGKLGNALWKAVYLSKQVSWRNRLMVLNDWTRKRIFGRDVTRLS